MAFGKNKRKLMKKELYQFTKFDDYNEYVKIQYRCDPKEFLNGRLHIVSSFVYILRILESLNELKPKHIEEGRLAGQLISYDISILDAGARDGWTVQFLNDLGYKNVTGAELLEEYVEYCKALKRNVVQGDLHALPFDKDAFEFCYSRHTLEHCLDPIKVINEMFRVTKKEGYLYFSFPMERKTLGKHTIAIPDIETINEILQKINYKYEPIYIGKAKDTNIVIPEGNEAIVFLKKIKKKTFGLF